MNLRYEIYTVLWVLFCIAAVFVLIRDWKQLRLEWQSYFRFLTVPWKLAIFFPAFLFVTFAGHFTNDETWDVVTGSGMSILTFLTAPWAAGVYYQVMKGRRPMRYLIVVIALCFFSSSWFYDAYLFWRDGEYSSRWLGNLLLSPVIYIAAGLLWNLEAKSGGGTTLSFLRHDWPSRPKNISFMPIIPMVLPLIVIAAIELIAFVKWHF